MQSFTLVLDLIKITYNTDRNHVVRSNSMKIRRKGYLLVLVLYLCVSLNLEIRAEEGTL